MPPRVSVCIVNWNTRDFLRECLRSVQETAAELGPEVVVVDNASRDGSAEMVKREFPEVVLIANPQNVGYARGNNQALEATTGDYRLLLNPDIVVREGAIAELVACMDRHPRAAAAAPRLVNPDGSLQHSCRSFPDPDVIAYESLALSRLFPRSPRFGKYRMTWWGYDEERTVDQPMASALLLRSVALEDVGTFDESFPIFFNDVDLCRRLWDSGWEVWFTPAATMVHHGGAGTRQVRREMVAQSHRSLLRYYAKHYRGRVSPLAYHGARALIRLAAPFRTLLART
jgi:GT2 family glycosyltransferase